MSAIGGTASAASRVAPPQTASVQPSASGSAIVTCPAGTKTVSGGFSAPDFQKNGSTTVRFASVRTGKPGWKVDAIGLGQAPGSVVAHAYCARRPFRLRVRTAETTVDGNNFGGATALCGPREQSVAGGFASPGFMLGLGPHVIPLTSMKAGRRGWRVDGINPSFDDSGRNLPGRLVAYAYCRRGGPKIITRSSTAGVAGEELKSVDAYCPQGTEAISGGFDGHLTPTEMDLSASGAVESLRLPFGVGWRNTVVSVSDGPPATATAYAYCQRTTL